MGPRPKRLAVVVAASAAGLLAVVTSPAEAAPTPRSGGTQASTAPALVAVGPPTSRSGPQVAAARQAEVDTSLLTPGVRRTVSIDMIDTDLDVALEPVASGTPGWSAWSGTITAEPDASATIVRKGDDVAAMISTPGGAYRIRTTAPGEQVVQEIAGRFPESVDDGVHPPATLDLGIAPGDRADAATDQAPVAAGDVPTYPIVDVLVGYTPGALAEAGTQSAMNSEIALSIATTNTAYADSGVAGRVRLAGQTPVATELSLDQTSLNELTSRSDGVVDSIHALRNSTGADLVSVLTSDGTSCGLAWVLNSLATASNESPLGFSLVDYSCAVDNYTFPHELGHNMGLNHDRYVESAPELFPYALGYVNTTARWRTIMAYNDACFDLGFNCTRLGRFSNPDQTYEGAPLGRPSSGPNPADNRKALNNTHAFVASWRAKPAPFSSWSRFVAQQYRDFLGRSPSSSESSADAAMLNTGAKTPQAYIGAQLKGTFGANHAPVTRLYFAYFVRSPDPGGLDYWVRKYKAGMKLSAISSNFATSSEFKSKYGTLSNRAFVNKIYLNLFERTGDAGGVDFWTRRLDTRTNTRGQVMINFSESSEFKRVRAEEIDVVLLYRSMFQRSATPSEFANKVARLQGGAGIGRLILEALDSAEYRGRITP